MVCGEALPEETFLRAAGWEAFVLCAAFEEIGGNGGRQFATLRSGGLRQMASLWKRGVDLESYVNKKIKILFVCSNC